jgi:O-antigen ligase
MNPLTLIPGANWQHPNPRLQSAWNWARWGFALFPLLPSVGVCFIFAALVSTWRQAGGEIRQQRFNWGFAWLSPWLLVVSIFSIHPLDAIVGLVNFLPYFAFFAAYSTLIRSPEQLRQLAWIFLIPAVPIMLLGLLQLQGFGGILSIPGTPIIIWDIQPGGNPLGRMSSVLIYANSTAAYLQMVFIFGLGLLVDTYERAVNPAEGKQIWKSPALIGLVVFLLVCALSLILTSSRAAWSVALLSSLIFTIYQGWYWLVGMVSAIATLVLGAAYAPSPLKAPLRSIVPRYFWARITDEMYPNRPESLTRLSQWKFAGKMIQDRPITGWGLQSFGPLYQDFAHTWLGYPHNLLLMLASNLGIPATIALVSLVGWIIAQGTILFLNFPRQWRADRTLFFTYIVAFAGFMIFNITDVTALELRLNTQAWLLLASIYGLVRRAQVGNREIG